MDGHLVAAGRSEAGVQIVTVQIVSDLGDSDVEPCNTTVNT